MKNKPYEKCLRSSKRNRLLQINDDAETPITEEIGEEYFQYMQVLRSKINSVNDKIILDFGLVFDLYFDYSKRRVLDEEYLTKIYSYLKNICYYNYTRSSSYHSNS